MKNLYLTIAFVIVSTFAFAQYGPIPYRSVLQTVGEEYVVRPYKEAQTYGFSIYKGQDPSTKKHLSYNEGKDKVLKLASLFEASGFYGNGTYGIFTDNSGQYFTAAVAKDKFVGLALKSDYELARKTLINKTLWLKSNPDIKNEKGSYVNAFSSDSVIVTDVQLSDETLYPHRLSVKTKTGEVGFINVNAGGSPDIYNLKQFYDIFSAESPQIAAAKKAAAKQAKAKEIADAIEAEKAAAAKKEEELKNNPCPNIDYKFDKFDQEKTYSTAVLGMYDCYFSKVISKSGAISYYLSLHAIGISAMTTQQGVTILLKNGKRISKPNAEVETRVDSRAQFARSAFIRLTTADIALFKTSPIEGFKLYIDEGKPEKPEMLYNMFQCLLTK